MGIDAGFLGVTICNQMSLFQKDDTNGKTGCQFISPITDHKIIVAYADKDENPESSCSGLEYTFCE